MIAKRSLSAVLLAIGLFYATLCAQVPSQEVLEKLITDLDAEKYAVRQRAEKRLIEIGLPALPSLQQVVKDGSTEARYRARRAALKIEFESLRAEFIDLSRQPDQKMSVERGMWLIARVMNHSYSFESLDRGLDKIADRVRKELGEDVEPKSAEPAKVMEAMCSVLKDLGFRGNYEDYANPKNSSIEHVLATQKGLPILLSHVMIGVGERLDIPVVGLAIPGRYMVKYDGSRAPKSYPKADIIVDPFGEWEIVDKELLRIKIRGFDATEHLKPCSSRAAIYRMMVNLIIHYERDGNDDKAVRVAKYAQAFAPTNE